VDKTDHAPSDILSVGQEVEAVVLGVNKEEQKISLGLRQLRPSVG
jgi:small subunit ribosomal protein S1